MSILLQIRRHPERLSFPILIISAFAAFFIISFFYSKKQEELTLRIADSYMLYAKKHLSSLGDLTLKDSQMLAGNHLLNESTSFVDDMLQNTGFGCTIFLRNERISTTAKAKGSDQRAVGTKANDMITKLVYEQGETFLGNTNTIGKEWLIIYTPLKTPENKIIGMIALFREKAEFMKGNNIFKLILAFTLIGFCTIVFYYLRKSSTSKKEILEQQELFIKQLDTLSDFSVKIKNGNLDAKIDQNLNNNTLAKSLVDMQNSLKSIIEETKEIVIEAGKNGNLAARIHNNNKHGAWSELCNEINRLIESIATPIVNVNNIVDGMSSGDLTKRLPLNKKGEILNLSIGFNESLNSVNYLLHSIHDQAGIVRNSTSDILKVNEKFDDSVEDISGSIADINQGAQKQLDEVDGSSKLIGDLLRSSSEMEDQAQKVNQEAENGVKSSFQGVEVIEEISNIIEHIYSYSLKTDNSFDALDRSTEQISEVISVIVTIASQTHMLALNAAIQASNAGETGKGFSIVAEEIRKLSEETSSSALKIGKLIESVQHDKTIAANDINVMNDSIKSGNEQIHKASEVFTKINSSSNENLKLSKKILTTAKSQINSIENFASFIENTLITTKQTASDTSNISSLIESLSAGIEENKGKYKNLANASHFLTNELEKFKLSKRSTKAKNNEDLSQG